ncbi:hypothetical protein RJ640_018811, partial [Escallonia rubra]
MISPTLGQCVCMLFCLVILVNAEDSGVNITIVENAVATGAGQRTLVSVRELVFLLLSVHFTYALLCYPMNMLQFVWMGVHQLTILTRELEMERTVGWFIWRIVVRYCDGSSFTGEAEEVDPALLTGCSAGGLASILHCDNFRDLMPATARRSAANLPPSCTSKMEPTLCFYAQYVVPQIQTPLFILNPAYDTYQVRVHKNTGQIGYLFIERTIYKLLLYPLSIYGWSEMAMAKALGDWYYDRSGFQQIDFKHDLPHFGKTNALRNHGLLSTLGKRIVVRYCDGSSFTGEVEEVDPCFYAQNLVPQIQTPLFILNSAYDTYQVVHNNIGQIGDLFIKRTVYKLLLCPLPIYGWKEMAMAKALGDWYHDRSGFQQIDFKHDLPQ